LKDIVASGLARKKPQMPWDYKPNCLRSHSTPQWIAPENAFAGYDLVGLPVTWVPDFSDFCVNHDEQFLWG
jgi:hypothetical protein